ncbi:MAG TPA: hypothetical protein VFV67_23950 [Actinophytocola sp.]|uniref:hypothetical protein n=1 Tax=Actinophytocola sp. TaxID=1872138 RepID=UPI002DBF0D7A|nr:hypothetical protein [Actinophytocola sp.]HEU5473712.1 hypothetical protein [Actinophytocola sp.]
MLKVRTVLLAGLIGLTLVGTGGVAIAQEEPTLPPPAESSPPPTEPIGPGIPPTQSQPVVVPAPVDPPPSNPAQDDGTENDDPAPILPAELAVASVCTGDAGSVEVSVTNPSERGTAYVVDLLRADGSADPLQTQNVSLEQDETKVIKFPVDAGAYQVRAHILDLVTVADVSVDRCAEIGPVDDPVQVFVRCEDGAGVVTIRVFNIEGDSRTFTVTTEELELPEGVETVFELDNLEYRVVVDELPTDDGTFAVKVVANGVDHTESVTVDCTTPPTTTTTTTTTTPAAQASAGTANLADTGASVGGIAVLGLIAFGLGGGLLLAGRRRRTN